MGPSSQHQFDPAGAGALMLAATGACVGVGCLVGWAAGSTGLGAAGGAAVGVPVSVAAVYYRYRGGF